MAEGAILVALTSATFDYDGQPVWILQDRTTVREGHPMLAGREHLFGPLRVDHDLPQEAPATGTQKDTLPQEASAPAQEDTTVG